MVLNYLEMAELETAERVHTFMDFVKALPRIARDETKSALDMEPNEKEFTKFEKMWVSQCVLPPFYKLACQLVMVPDADPEDLIRGTSAFLDANDTGIEKLVIPAGEFNKDAILEIMALMRIQALCSNHAKIASDLAQIAQFQATLERVEGKPGFFRVPEESKAALKATLGVTYVNVDAYLEKIGDPTQTGQVV